MRLPIIEPDLFARLADKHAACIVWFNFHSSFVKCVLLYTFLLM